MTGARMLMAGLLAGGLLTGCSDRVPTAPTAPSTSAAPSASAGRTPAALPGPALVLGDSVAFGVGDDEGGGYPRRLIGLLRGGTCAGAPCPSLALVDLSRPGATSRDVVTEQLPRAVEELERAGARPSLVVLTVGGNDVVGPLSRACGDGEGRRCADAVTRVLPPLERSLDRTLTALRAAGGDEAVLAVMTYYDPFPACERAELSPLAQRVLDGDPAGGLPSLNESIAAAARRVGALVVPTREVVGPAELVGGRDCLHPNAAGHQAIAEAFAAVVAGPLGR